MELELGLDPDDASRLTRLPLLAPMRSGKARSKALRIVWHDSPDRALTDRGLVMAEQRPLWRLERVYPDGAGWPPGEPAPVLASGTGPAALGISVPDPLVPVAAFEGRAAIHNFATESGALSLTLLNGVVRAVAGEHRICRVRLQGPEQRLQDVACAIAGELDLAVPRASLAAEALAIASGIPPTPRREGAPELRAGVSVSEAFAHVVGHLTDVILYFAETAAEAHEGPEPVHQMRVAVRRLRSAIKVFHRAVRCPGVEAANAGLRALAARLAPTRDWDVFVTETAAQVGEVFADDKRFQRLISAAERRRRVCHDELRAYLLSAEFRRLGIELACLAASQEWQVSLGEAEQIELAAPLDEFIGRVLGKRLKRLVQADGDVAHLAPSDLHVIRLRAKRLRYAAEIFAPLYPGKSAQRYIRRLTRLQDQLGTLNDAAVAGSLLADLGANGGSHAYATGLVLGFVGARSRRTREKIDKQWEKFERLTPFWEQ